MTPKLSSLSFFAFFLAFGAIAISALAGAPGYLQPPEPLRLSNQLPVQLPPSKTMDVEISITGPQGKPVDIASELGRRVPRDWPTKPEVFVVPISTDAGGDTPWHLLRTREVSGRGMARFHLEPQTDYAAVLLAPGALAHIEPFRFDRRGDIAQLNLQHAAPGPIGSVTVDVRNPDGGAHHNDTAIFVLHRETGIPLVGHESGRSLLDPPKRPWPPRFTLPIGEYTLLVRTEPRRDWHGRVRAGRKHGDARMPFTVLEDASVDLVVPLTWGAFLEVELKGIALPSDLASVRLSFAQSKVRSLIPHEELAQRVLLTLHCKGAYPIPVEFTTFTMRNSSAAGKHLVPWIQLGKHTTSEGLTEGHYRLEARLPGGRLLTQEVELVGGESLQVTFDFGGS